MNKCIFDKDNLKNLYLNKKYTIKQIASELNCSVGKVFNSLKKHNIRTRKLSEIMNGFKHTAKSRGRMSLAGKGRKFSEKTKQLMSKARKGKFTRASEYGGHEKMHKNGYIMVYLPTHPFATKDGYVFKHILAYERYHGFLINRNIYCVHHKNENKLDNSMENLELMHKSNHMRHHANLRHIRRMNNESYSANR